MYEAFYQLREKPFHVTSNPAFLYFSKRHQEAMEHLLYGIRERLGFLMITGEVGTGKTTLVKALLEKLKPPTQTALILNPNLSAAQFLQAVVRDFGIPNGGRTRGTLHQALEQFLIQETHKDSTAVLIVDEAQALGPSTLEQIRLLSNVETPSRKLIQIVLVGQPELSERLGMNFRLRALHQRIAIAYHLTPLDPEEVGCYIDHRIQAAGPLHGGPQFTHEAVALIAKLSGGIPRRINLICDQALLAGFVQGSASLIDLGMVQQTHWAQDHPPRLKAAELTRKS